jgi:hypothetical protein
MSFNKLMFFAADPGPISKLPRVAYPGVKISPFSMFISLSW